MTARLRRHTAILTLVLSLGPLLLAGCGSGSGGADSGAAKAKEAMEKAGLEKAADTSTCIADAKPFSGTLPANFPRAFPLPDGTVLYNVEDRGTDGVIGTGVVKAGLKDVLGMLNGKAQDDGFAVSNGETEDHDAEANWAGNGFRGRWAIRDSATCNGEVVIQLLSKKQ